MSRALPAWSVAGLIVLGVLLGLGGCTAVLVGVKAAQDHRPRSADLYLHVQAAESGGSTASTSCSSADGVAREGAAVRLSDAEGKRLAVAHLSRGRPVPPDGCSYFASFSQDVTLAETYLVSVDGHPSFAVHPERTNICDPDSEEFGDTLLLQVDPPVGCGG